MSQFSFNISPELQKIISKNLNELDRIAPMMLNEATPIVRDYVRNNMPDEVSHYADQCVVTDAKPSKKGGWIANLNFRGNSSDGTRLMQLMAYWEYGTYKGTRIPKKGFLRYSLKCCEDLVNKKMLEVYEREITK